MKAKKVICIILTFILAFTLLSGPWRAEVEAAGPAIAVAVVAIVGFFIVTSGYTFDSQADFRTATDAFMESEAAQYVTKIHEIVTDVSSAGLSLANFNLAKIITQPWFLEFWAAIQDFFGGGEVPGATLTAPDGFAYFNGTLLPDLPTTSEYDWLYSTYSDPLTSGRDYGWYCPMIFEDDNYYYLYFWAWPYHQQSINSYRVDYLSWYSDSNDPYSLGASDFLLFRTGRYASAGFYYSKGGDFTFQSNDWSFSIKYESSSSDMFNRGIGTSEPSCNNGKLWNIVWSAGDILIYSDCPGYNEGDVYLSGSQPSLTISDGVIGVYEDENIVPPSDVIGGFDAGAIDGSIDWALDSSSVYQDLTAAGDVPLTATQTGALTEAGVEVQTAVKVETMEEYRTPGLTTVFPFCIPFDIYRFLSILTAEREAPHFEFNLNFGELGSHEIEVDLSEWESVAAVLRTIELLAFCVGLAFATSKVIKW